MIIDQGSSPQATYNWPHNQLQEDDLLIVKDNLEQEETVESQKPGFELDLDAEVIEKKNSIGQQEKIETEQNEWGIEDLDIPDLEIPSKVQEAAPVSMFDYAEGRDAIYEKTKNSQVASELVSCGYFEAAKSLLKKQIGAVNVDSLNPIFGRIYVSSNLAVTGLPFTLPYYHIISNENNRPYVMNSLQNIEILLNKGYQLSTMGKFQDAIITFREVLWNIPLIVLNEPAKENDIHAMIRICIEYIIGFKCEITRKQLNSVSFYYNKSY